MIREFKPDFDQEPFSFIDLKKRINLDYVEFRGKAGNILCVINSLMNL